jgi:dipeptidyl-peptidase-3
MKKHLITVALAGSLISACAPTDRERVTPRVEEQRKYKLERAGPANVVQLYADGFEQLKTQEKILVYYLSLAALAGRDIAIDQHHRDALEVRQVLQQLHQYSAGIDPAILRKLDDYLKLFWINNGFYDDLTSKKFVPDCSFEDFRKACDIALQNAAHFDLAGGENLKRKLENLRKVIFDPAYEPVLTDKTPGTDFIAASAVNFYARGLTFGEVEAWAKAGKEKNSLNSFVTKENRKIGEEVWRAGGSGAPLGMYAADLKAVIKYLQMAIPYASSGYQAETIRKLIRFFETGNLEDFRQYNIHWVKDSSNVDFIMGFIEVYLDPRGQKAEWEASIFYNDPEQTKLMQNLAKFAQYFEDNAPWSEAFKKKIEHSPIANVINVVMETGGTGPVSPVGINLPNEQAIRQQYGSKSVLLHNIVEAYDKSQGKVLVKEFAWDAEEAEMEDKYGSRADNLHTAMHEVIGHGSGKVSDKLKGKDPSDFLPGYYNTLEEARADLMALWNAWDEKLVDIGLAKDKDEARKIGETMFRQAVRVALTQLRRIGKSDQLSEDHMKDRALIGHYLIDHSNGVKVEIREGKTYYRIVDFESARKSAGELLAEIMRIKAEGDLDAAKALIDKYGLKVDAKLRDEVQERVKKLDIPSYTGFVMPRLEPVRDGQGKIVEVKVSYPLDLAKQMLEYSQFTKAEKEAVRSRKR